MKRVEVMDWSDHVDDWYDGLNDAYEHNLPNRTLYEYLDVLTEEDYEV